VRTIHPLPQSSTVISKATHVFLRQDTICRALDPPFNGPDKVTEHTQKTFNISVRGKQVIVSAVYISAETRHGTANRKFVYMSNKEKLYIATICIYRRRTKTDVKVFTVVISQQQRVVADTSLT
jgi:hypothetical protein